MSWRKFLYKWLGVVAVSIVLALYGVWFLVQFIDKGLVQQIFPR